VNSVCHVADGHLSLGPPWIEWLEESLADRTVQLADTIDSPASANGKERHVKGLRSVELVPSAQAQEIVEFDSQLVLGISLQILPNQCRREAVTTGFDRRVCREQISSSRHGQSNVEGLTLFFHITESPFKHHKRGMSFVQMTNLGANAKCVQKPPAS
jgi:hypothetical protein